MVPGRVSGPMPRVPVSIAETISDTRPVSMHHMYSSDHVSAMGRRGLIGLCPVLRWLNIYSLD